MIPFMIPRIGYEYIHSFDFCLTESRYDVLLTADQAPSNYWISVHSQYRTGSPSGYAVLRYSNATQQGVLPGTLTPQPSDTPPWSLGFVNQVRGSSRVVGFYAWAVGFNSDSPQLWVAALEERPLVPPRTQGDLGSL